MWRWEVQGRRGVSKREKRKPLDRIRGNNHGHDPKMSRGEGKALREGRPRERSSRFDGVRAGRTEKYTPRK